jgi:3-hydroxyisobutyrate dehydrogenase-like beta-hydroxyacid dehydrogenase
MGTIDLRRIGFAGVSIMGDPMVRRLLDQGRLYS